MSIVEELRREYNTLKTELDRGKLALSNLNEVQKELNAGPEFNAIFALREAEVNYYIAEAEVKLERLNNEIEKLEAQARD